MAEHHHFRVDLGYEEMGFRSQLFFNEFDSSAGGFNSLRRSFRDPLYASDDVDILSDQFSSMSLLRHNPRTTPLPSSGLLLQPLRSHGRNADQRLYGRRSNMSLGTTDPFYELHLSRLCKNESLGDIRAMVLQRQESQLNKGLKESVGTGVFHPLHFHQRRAYNKSTNSMKKRNQRNRNRNRNQNEELLANESKEVTTTTTTMQQQQQEECHYHLPSDMDFSKDWTF